MTAAVRAGVKRVVVTSSTAAVYFQGNGEAIKAAGEGKEANENNEVKRRGWECDLLAQFASPPPPPYYGFSRSSLTWQIVVDHVYTAADWSDETHCRSNGLW